MPYRPKCLLRDVPIRSDCGKPDATQFMPGLGTKSIANTVSQLQRCVLRCCEAVSKRATPCNGSGIWRYVRCCSPFPDAAPEDADGLYGSSGRPVIFGRSLVGSREMCDVALRFQ